MCGAGTGSQVCGAVQHPPQRRTLYHRPPSAAYRPRALTAIRSHRTHGSRVPFIQLLLWRRKPLVTTQCPDGCGKCCWAVPIPLELWEEVQELTQCKVKYVWHIGPHQVLPITDDMHCPFLTREKRCAIHPRRPAVCRNYGYGDNPCPYLRRDGKPRTELGVARFYAGNGPHLDDASNFTVKETYTNDEFVMEIRVEVTYARKGTTRNG